MDITIPKGVELKDTTIVVCEEGVIINNYPNVKSVVNKTNIKYGR